VLYSVYVDAQFSTMMKKYLPSELQSMPQMPEMPSLVKEMMEAPKRKAEAQRKLMAARMARYKRLRAYAMAVDRKKNPYNKRPSNSVISPANSVRRPGAVNILAVAKNNPYGKKPTVKPTSNPYRKVGHKSNPYARSPVSKPVPRVVQPKIDAESVRLLGGNPYAASRAPGMTDAKYNELTRKAKMYMHNRQFKETMKEKEKQMKEIKKFMDQPKKQKAAMQAGCQPLVPMGAAGGGAATPMQSMVSSMLTMQMRMTCRNPMAMTMCMMNAMAPKCVDIGISAMCCPNGITSEAAVQMKNYMGSMQKYTKQMMRFMENIM